MLPLPVSDAPRGPAPLAGEATVPELKDAVLARHSTRTFSGERLRPEHLAFLNAYLADPQRLVGPLGRPFRIVLLRDLPRDKQVGTYGYTKGYDGILAAIGPDDPLALFELAYVLHGLVLELTHLGVDSVWMGGSFSRKDMKKSVNLQPDELIGAMVAVGYDSGKKRWIDFASKHVLKATQRKPMDFFYFVDDFAHPIEDVDYPIRAALDAARRAPSAKNKQSWRGVITDGGKRVHIYAKFSLKGQVGTGFRQYACPPEYLDVGTWYRSFEAALAADGIAGTLSVEDPGLAPPDGEDVEYLVTWTMG